MARIPDGEIQRLKSCRLSPWLTTAGGIVIEGIVVIAAKPLKSVPIRSAER